MSQLPRRHTLQPSVLLHREAAARTHLEAPNPNQVPTCRPHDVAAPPAPHLAAQRIAPNPVPPCEAPALSPVPPLIPDPFPGKITITIDDDLDPISQPGRIPFLKPAYNIKNVYMYMGLQCIVPFWLRPVFFLGIIIYCPKRNYLSAFGYILTCRTHTFRVRVV